MSRNKLIFAAGIAVTAALIIGLGVSIVALLKAQSDRSRALTAERHQALARTQAEEAGQIAIRERKRAEAELWNSRLSEAKALRFAGGPGARVESAALLQELTRRSELSEIQLLALRREAIGQLALVDIAMPTNWVSKGSWHLLAWDATLERFVRSAGSNQLDLCEFPSERVIHSFSVPPSAEVSHAFFTPDEKFVVVAWTIPPDLFWRGESMGPRKRSCARKALIRSRYLPTANLSS